MSKVEIFAVHKRKLKDFLKKLGLWEPFEKGEIECVICGTTISFDNIGLVIPCRDKITMCCSSAECIFRVRELQGAETNED